MAEKVIVVNFLPRSGLLKVVKLVKITDMLGIIMMRWKGLHGEGNTIQIKCPPVENTDASEMFRLSLHKRHTKPL